jgi:hypothetical protein
MGVPTGIPGDRAENRRDMRMAKTIAELESLLTSHGYTCERMLDAIVATISARRSTARPCCDAS